MHLQKKSDHLPLIVCACALTAQIICVFVFAFAKMRFHDAARILCIVTVDRNKMQ